MAFSKMDPRKRLHDTYMKGLGLCYTHLFYTYIPSFSSCNQFFENKETCSVRMSFVVS